MSCEKCGRTGLCDTCCCVHPSHNDRRGLTCPLCKHPVPAETTPVVSHRWVNVIVYRYPSPTNPVIVNVYGFETKKQAQASQRKANRDAKTMAMGMVDAHGESRLIANRVRPVLVDGLDYNVWAD